MTGVRCAAALLGLALAAPPAPAQGFFVFHPDPYFAFPAGGASFSYGRWHGHGHFALSAGGLYGPGFGPYGYASNQVTVVYAAPPVIVVPSLSPADLEGLTLERLRESLRDDAAAADRLPHAEQHFGGFHKVEPQGRRPEADLPKPEALPPPVPKADAPPPAPPPAPKPPPAGAPPALPPGPPPELPRPPAPMADPDAESARLAGLGRAAFANREYGRAAERFRQAAALTPNLPPPEFLLAETLFAQGKYHDAVDAIRAGMVLQPDWPNSRFPPLDLYGPNPADFDDHLRALADALDRRPGDPDLLFLDAVMLWFDGRRDDARPLLLRALPVVADPAMVQRFLRAAAGGAAL